MSRLHAAVALLSGALVALQLILMQLLSIVQWHHFAYMVISVALLGFGAAGTLLSLFRKQIIDRSRVFLPGLMMLAGATMAAVGAASQAPFARFDSYELFLHWSNAGRLFAAYLLFFVPFFLGAVAIGIVFVRHARHVGSYYFANLAGSGLGGAAAVAAMWILQPEVLPAVTGLVAILAGMLIVPRKRRLRLTILALSCAAVALFFLIRPPGLVPSQYKGLQRTLNLPGAEVVVERTSPLGLVQVVRSPVLRHAPGLSLTFTGEAPVQQAVFNNGNWYGPVTGWSRLDSTHLLDYTTAALPFAVGARESVLVLGAGTLEEVAHAVTRGAEHVVAVEPHSAVLDLLGGALAQASDSLLFHPAVTAHAMQPRTYLSRTRERYDLIALPAIGAFGGSVGLFALHEQYLLTRQAFEEMWLHLEPDGVLSVTAWMDYPYRAPLRLLTTIVEALEEVGVARVEDHLAAVRSWGTVTYVVGRTPLRGDQVARVRSFAERLNFDPLALPDIRPEERDRFNLMQDERFFALVDDVLSPRREVLYDTYDFAVEPPTDGRPYFSQFVRWKSADVLLQQFGGETFPFLEIGYFLAGVTLLQVVLAAFGLIVLPLSRIGLRGGGRTWTLVYFGALGLGFMFVEMVLIQRFTLFLGHPIYATAAVLAALLCFSGLGSLASERLLVRPTTLQLVAAIVAALLLLYARILTPLLDAGIAWPLAVRVVVTLALLGPVAFVMGMPFPLGLRFLSRRSTAQVPWAWGINGCLSVVSAALAALLAVELGFASVMAVAAGVYATAALITIGRRSGPLLQP